MKRILYGKNDTGGKMLSEKIKNVIDETSYWKCFIKDSNFDDVKRFVLERNIKQIVEDDFMEKNPDEMIDEYSNYFKGKNISKTVIDDKKDYYRARIGYRSELGGACEIISVNKYFADIASLL